MTDAHLSPIEVLAVRIIADAKWDQTSDCILVLQLFALANDCKKQGYEKDHQAVLRTIGYILAEVKGGR